MSNKIDLNKYKDFVSVVTSDQSNDLKVFVDNAHALEKQAAIDGIKLNFPLLLTAAIGIGAEGGEFAEIVKKMAFQGKPYNEDTRFHCLRELGDVFWYWTNACRALGYDPNDVIAENVKKLEARYPGGSFDPYYSENRKENDL
jgi:NTP pyrophosphatase (non-canonical NTP hydrolase)